MPELWCWEAVHSAQRLDTVCDKFTIRDVGKFIQPKEEEHRRREIRRGSG